ncbi:MAG: hypothetical protein IMZ61_00255 [Planctomycetes bacterium]|nr:hypothetical protein [Thermoplasmata archaeon]MBE3142349.1 hypothetical protein [Planctomycetota bacterium]
MDTRNWHGNIETIEIYASAIEEAKKAMTGKWVGFKSKVLEVISEGDRALITIETCGRLNIIRKRWDKFRVPAEQRKATGVPALEYMMGQQEKRGRGRPRKQDASE